MRQKLVCDRGSAPDPTLDYCRYHLLLNPNDEAQTWKQVVLAAYVERSSERNGNTVLVDKQSIPAIIKDHVVHRRKVVVADEEFAVSSWIDR